MVDFFLINEWPYSSAIAVLRCHTKKKAVLDLLTLEVSDHYWLLDLQSSTVILWRLTIDMYTPTYNAIK